jgi:hypothetical protein
VQGFASPPCEPTGGRGADENKSSFHNLR